MNGVLNRKLLFVLGPVTGLVMFAGVVMIATFLTNREYNSPTGLPPRPSTPRRARKAWRPREPQRRRRRRSRTSRPISTFPVVGSRVAIWAVAHSTSCSRRSCWLSGSSRS